jgi:predicted alpha/beta superfamily hydrolase
LGEIREVKSKINDVEYELIINYPYSYFEDTTKYYPVIYFTDGFYDFPLLSSIYGGLFYDKRIPEFFIVGFSYKGNVDYGSLRMNDYLPTTFAESNIGGGAANFLKVVENDFISFMENNFRVTKALRALGGSSAGGAFTLFAMFTNPDLFNAYISISPAVELNNNWMFEFENEYYKKSRDLSVSLYMTGAEKELPERPNFIKSIIKFDEVLKNRNYENFRYKFSLLDDAYHASSKPEGFTRGLQFIFEPLLKLK